MTCGRSTGASRLRYASALAIIIHTNVSLIGTVAVFDALLTLPRHAHRLVVLEVAVIADETLHAAAGRDIADRPIAVTLIVGGTARFALEIVVAGLTVRTVGVLDALLAVAVGAKAVASGALIVADTLLATKLHRIAERFVSVSAVVVCQAANAGLGAGVTDLIAITVVGPTAPVLAFAVGRTTLRSIAL
jgi:hypothetical protein